MASHCISNNHYYDHLFYFLIPIIFSDTDFSRLLRCYPVFFWCKLLWSPIVFPIFIVMVTNCFPDVYCYFFHRLPWWPPWLWHVWRGSDPPQGKGGRRLRLHHHPAFLPRKNFYQIRPGLSTSRHQHPYSARNPPHTGRWDGLIQNLVTGV